jgi:cytidine deaminase
MGPAPEPHSISVDWAALRSAAVAASERSYSPYSRFAVGAAALIDDGRVVVGANIENASYGITMCAENSMVAAYRMGGDGKIVAVAVVGNGRPTTPCGRCRQLLWEFGGADCLVDVDGRPTRLGDLLPHAFPESSGFAEGHHP